MTVLPVRQAIAAGLPAESALPRIWGLNPLELYERYWRSHGVQVVRRGRTTVERNGPSLFLLLDPDELIVFDLPPRCRRLRHRRAGLMRVDVVDPDQESYAERIEAGDRDILIAVRREYLLRPRSSARVMMTADRDLAELWATAPDRRTASRRLADAAGPRLPVVVSACGHVFSAADGKRLEAAVTTLVGRWRDINLACPAVGEVRPGAWAHETVGLGSGARLVGPVWLGAGVTLGSQDVVIGPRFEPDRVIMEPVTAPVRWPRLARARGSFASTAAPHTSRPGKRLFDIVFSVVALLLTAPLMPLIMLAIWLEDGRPFIFSHTRQTLGGRTFACHKFRTMRMRSEHLKDSIMADNICDGPHFHFHDDPRVLRVGRFLRRHHLDELPQFWDVLRGQMSVVGPRPSPDDENRYCPTWREARLSVRPGITGLWQVSRTRAPNQDFREWIRHDLDYVQRQNWRLDLRILFQTAMRMLRA